MSDHLRHIHDRIHWVCPLRTCRRRFVTEEEVIKHIQDEDEHASQTDEPPVILLKLLYYIYHSPTAREFFEDLGLIHQEATTLCRNLQRDYEMHAEEATRSAKHYTLHVRGRQFVKDYSWWALFFAQEEGPQLDKFIGNAALGGQWCQISHRCHFGWCLNAAAHLEQVLRPINDDRSICQRGTRSRIGGCAPFGQPSAHRPISAVPSPSPLRLAPGQPTRQRASKNVGPCVNGHDTSWRNKWFRDPDNKTRQLCKLCYDREYYQRRKSVGKTFGLHGRYGVE
ncbi:hypothetical protein BDR22DRAFT_821726 [Usnea florida]